MRQWWPVLAVMAFAAVLALVLGPGYAGYDASWALVWGREIAGGALPSYLTAFAPTPHPLVNAIAVVMSPFGDGGEHAFVAFTFISFAALAAGTLALVARLAWWPAGVVAALLAATCGLLDREAGFASADLPFLALVVGACAVQAGEARRPLHVLALLAFAGLIRPEAWLLSLVYVAWLAREHRDLRMPILLALCGPLLWALSDLVIASNPVHSLTGTRDLAAELGRPTGFSTALNATRASLTAAMGPLVLAAGLVGMCGGLLLAPRRMVIPVMVLCCGLVTFLAIGAAGLPVLQRYLLLPVSMLAVTAGVGLALPRLVPSGRPRRLAALVSATVGLLLITSLPSTIDDVRAARSFTLSRGDVNRDLRALTATPGFRTAAARCPRILAPDFRARPVLLLDSAIDADRVVVGNLPDGEPGLLVTYATPKARLVFNLGAPGEARMQAVPVGGKLVARNRSWLASAVC